MPKGKFNPLRPLIGDFHWDAPAWLRAMWCWLLGILATRKDRPGRFWGLSALVLVVVALGVGGYVTWRLMPQPVLTQVQVTTPGITQVGGDGKLYPRPVVLHFSTEYKNPTREGARSAANLSLLGKTITRGIKLTPSHAGQWRWENNNTLIFTTNKDWPAGTQYHVHLAPRLFAPGIRLADDTPTFTTPGIGVRLERSRLYQNPKKPSELRVVATFRFDHGVKKKTIRKHLSLRMRKSGDSVEVRPGQVSYRLKLSRHGRMVYVTSKPLTLPKQTNYMLVTLSRGVKAALGDSVTQRSQQAQVRIPAVSTYFRVHSLRTRVIRNKDRKPLQTLILKVTDSVKAKKAVGKLRAYLLPKGKHWELGEVTPEVLSKSKQIRLQANPSVHPYAKLLSFTYHAPEERQVYVKMSAGLVSHAGFTMTVPYRKILRAPDYPREVNIIGQGSLLTLSGSRKIMVQSRGVPALKAKIYRLKDSQFVHLITQTRGDLSQADFDTYHFDENNIAKRYVRTLSLHPDSPAQAVYTALNLSSFLKKSGMARGMFVVDVQGWNPKKKKTVGGSGARRFILLTDQAIIAKDDADKTHDLFVHDLTNGRPVANASVRLLGINGTTVYVTHTDGRGHASVPDVSGFKAGRKPAVYVVRHGKDTTFLPFKRRGRRLNYSRFDVGGIHAAGKNGARQLRAAVFTDRGLYRPGDSGHLGIIIKRNDWGRLAGVPVKIVIKTPQDKTLKHTSVTLPQSGFVDTDFSLQRIAPTGTYRVSVYLLDEDNKPNGYLGGATFQVEMFKPDQLRIKARLSNKQPAGWHTAMHYKARVNLQNLFGLPAQGHRVTGKYTLAPASFRFPAYPGFKFTNPFSRNGNSLQRSVTHKLGDTKTDKQGKTAFDLNLSGYARGVYWLTFTAKGFNTGGGGGVTTNKRIRVSPAKRLVGWISSSRLSYLPRGSKQSARFIVINPNLKKIAAKDLRLRRVRLEHISTLVEQDNGTLAYQTVTKRVTVNTSDFDITAKGRRWTIPTAHPGDYVVHVLDGQGRVLAGFDYTVTGTSSMDGAGTRHAKLRLDLNRSSYRTGQDIALQIKSPYTGTGLITIERDKVYAFKWFTTHSRQTIQHIRVPKGVEGNAYVNVTFVRSPDSPNLFTDPMSYAVAPFSIDRSARTIKIHMDVPDRVKPGDTLPIHFQTNRPGRIVVYAVDEGILQVANYHTPQPLDTFMRKRALQVNTSQMADLLMPEFRMLQHRMATGGGSQAAKASLKRNLNPFARNIKAPVVYWSGIVDATGKPQTLQYRVPDSFDGELTIMAVAVSPQAAGSTTTHTKVRGPFVLEPNVITAVAPGDTFQVSVGVTNALPAGSGDAPITLRAKPDQHLDIVGDKTDKLTLSPGEEGRATFRVRATRQPGQFTALLVAHSGKHQLERTATLSVRPAVPYRTHVQSGTSGSGEGAITPARSLLPVLAVQRAKLGYSPVVLAGGLIDYLNNYPYTCSEQLISGVFGELVLLDNPVLSLDRGKVIKRYHKVLQSLRMRQVSDGGFVFWPNGRQSAPLLSVYAAHFLTVARAAGMDVPNSLLDSALDHLQQLAERDPANANPYVQAYAIYVLTRNGRVTTNLLTHLQTYLKRHSDGWRHSMTAAFMAASYKQLKLSDLAGKLIADVPFAKPDASYAHFMDSSAARNAQLVYLLALHFPSRLEARHKKALQALTRAVSNHRYNTYSASDILLAMGAWFGASRDQFDTPLRIRAEIAQPGKKKPVQKTLISRRQLAVQTHVPLQATRLKFTGDPKTRLFYSFSQSGYNSTLAKKAVHDGLEVTREYLDADGHEVTSASLGSTLTVRIRVRGLTGSSLGDTAIVALLPGGFDVQRDTLNRGSAKYVDIRDDRVVIYTNVGPRVRTFTYHVHVKGRGTFTVPPVYADVLYAPGRKALTATGKFTVTAP